MNNSIIRITVALCASITAASIAQTHTWINPSGGAWTNPLNWSPNEVPQGPSASPLLPDLGSTSTTITLPPSLSLGSLEIQAPYELVIEDSLTMTGSVMVHNSAVLSATDPGSGATVFLESGAALTNAPGSPGPAAVTLADTTLDVFNGSIHRVLLTGSGSLRSSGNIDLHNSRLVSIDLVASQFNYAEFRISGSVALEEVSILLAPSTTQPVLRINPGSVLELSGTIENRARIFVEDNARVLVHGSAALIGPGGIYAHGPTPTDQIAGSTPDASLALIDHSLQLSRSESKIQISLSGDLSVPEPSVLHAPFSLEPTTQTLLQPAAFRGQTAVTSTDTIHLAGLLRLRRTSGTIAHGNAWTARLIHAKQGFTGAYDEISSEPTDRPNLFTRVRITNDSIIAGDVCPADLTMDFRVNEDDIIAFEDAFASNNQLADLNLDGVINQYDRDAFDLFYITPCNPCRFDLNNDATIDHFDVSALLRGLASSDPLTDLNDDGMFDIRDVLAFIEAVASPCPGT